MLPSSRNIASRRRGIHSSKSGGTTPDRELSSSQELRALMTQAVEVLREVFHRPKSDGKEPKSSVNKGGDSPADSEAASSPSSKRATLLRVLKLIGPERRLLGLAVRPAAERAARNPPISTSARLETPRFRHPRGSKPPDFDVRAARNRAPPSRTRHRSRRFRVDPRGPAPPRASAPRRSLASAHPAAGCFRAPLARGLG